MSPPLRLAHRAHRVPECLPLQSEPPSDYRFYLEDPNEDAYGREAATDPLSRQYETAREGQKGRGPMTPEDVLEITRRGSLPARLRRPDRVTGHLRILRVIGVVHESVESSETLQPAAAAQLERLAGALTA